ncbi:DNA topoisomerase activator [Aureococcus anophagefferens]|nr:DNA topoisomerase activator [Aureococcus anophagefferens]
MSYFDAAALKNAWAGVAHWKAAAPRRALADGDAAAAKKPAPKKAKKKSDLDFEGPPPAADALAPPPAKKRGAGDPLCLGAAALKRAAANAALSLPQDLRVTLKDLRSLFLLEDVVVTAVAPPAGGDAGGDGAAAPLTTTAPQATAPRRAATTTTTAAARGRRRRRRPLRHPRRRRGELRPEDVPRAGRRPAGSGTPLGGSPGPELLACGRVVDKINISFATRAKKVDVRQLKTQMWRQVEEEPETDFASLVADVAGKQKQADVTMPFYFICPARRVPFVFPCFQLASRAGLLHLCNEKTLKLETPDGADINNFSISTQG